jgi:hypothetical protein
MSLPELKATFSVKLVSTIAIILLSAHVDRVEKARAGVSLSVGRRTSQGSGRNAGAFSLAVIGMEWT